MQACDLLAKRPLLHPPRPLILSKLDQKGRNQDHKGFKALPDFYRTKGHVHNKAELPSVSVRRYHSDPTSSSLHHHALPPPGSEGSQVTAGEKGPLTPAHDVIDYFFFLKDTFQQIRNNIEFGRISAISKHMNQKKRKFKHSAKIKQMAYLALEGSLETV